MNLNQYISGVTTNISSKIKPNSIPPVIVGNAFVDLANIVSGLTIDSDTTVTASNGITNSGGNVTLGGSLTGGTSLTLQGNILNFIDTSDSTKHTNFQFGNGVSDLLVSNDGTAYTRITQNPSQVNLLSFYNPQSIDVEVTLNSEELQLLFNNGGDMQSITMGLSPITIQDNITTTGMLYSGDYSATGTLNDRWLPDYGAVKNYVSNSSITASNGLTKSGNNIVLGGTLTGNTTITTTGFNFVQLNERFTYTLAGSSVGFDFYNSINNSSGTLKMDTANVNTNITDGVGGQSSQISLFAGSNISSASMTINGTTIQGGTQKGIYFVNNNPGIYVDDTLSNFGMQYVSDYSATGTLNDRWIPDWGAVKISAFTFQDGIINNNGVVGLGGTFTQDIVIEQGQHSLHLEAIDGSGDTSLFQQTASLLSWTTTDGNATASLNGTSTSTGLAIFDGSGASSSLNLNLDSLLLQCEISSLSTSIAMDNTGIGFADDNASLGAYYVADYSANGLLNDRWIPDLGTVKNLAAEKVYTWSVAGGAASFSSPTNSVGTIYIPTDFTMLRFNVVGQSTGTVNFNITYMNTSNTIVTTTVISLTGGAVISQPATFLVRDGADVTLTFTISAGGSFRGGWVLEKL